MNGLELPNPKTGGSIHPVSHYGCVASEGCRANPGLTIRDYFAAKALQALVTHNVTGKDGREGMALFCYAMADAMLEARKK